MAQEPKIQVRGLAAASPASPTLSRRVEGPIRGQDDVNAVAHAVMPQGLAEILVAGLEVRIAFGQVHEAAHAQGAVDHETAELPDALVKSSWSRALMNRMGKVKLL